MVAQTPKLCYFLDKQEHVFILQFYKPVFNTSARCGRFDGASQTVSVSQCAERSERVWNEEGNRTESDTKMYTHIGSRIGYVNPFTLRKESLVTSAESRTGSTLRVELMTEAESDTVGEVEWN